MTEHPDTLSTSIALADVILDLVDKHAPEGVQSRDRNDQMVVLAFGRAFRCFRSIRDIAALHQEADDALILTRALLSTALRSLWAAQPDDANERERRIHILTIHSFREARKQAQALELHGFESDISAQKWDEMGASREADHMPSDFDMAEALDMDAIYAHVYRAGSASVHYSVTAALEGFASEGISDEAPSPDGLRIRFRDGQADRAARVVRLAALTYVAFLELAEPIVSHGVAEIAKKLLEELIASEAQSDPAG